MGNCKGFFTVFDSLSTSFAAERASQGTLGYDFDILAASGESIAWVLLWKTRSRPIGVRLRPLAQFDFFSTAFDPRGASNVLILPLGPTVSACCASSFLFFLDIALAC